MPNGRGIRQPPAYGPRKQGSIEGRGDANLDACLLRPAFVAGGPGPHPPATERLDQGDRSPRLAGRAPGHPSLVQAHRSQGWQGVAALGAEVAARFDDQAAVAALGRHFRFRGCWHQSTPVRVPHQGYPIRRQVCTRRTRPAQPGRSPIRRQKWPVRTIARLPLPRDHLGGG